MTKQKTEFNFTIIHKSEVGIKGNAREQKKGEEELNLLKICT